MGYSVAVEGKVKVPPGAHVKIEAPQKETGGDTFAVIIAAASTPKPDKSNKPCAKAVVVPYWLVRQTDDKDRANMHRSTLSCKTAFTTGKKATADDAILMPILQNSKVVNEGENCSCIMVIW